MLAVWSPSAREALTGSRRGTHPHHSAKEAAGATRKGGTPGARILRSAGGLLLPLDTAAQRSAPAEEVAPVAASSTLGSGAERREEGRSARSVSAARRVPSQFQTALEAVRTGVAVPRIAAPPQLGVASVFQFPKTIHDEASSHPLPLASRAAQPADDEINHSHHCLTEEEVAVAAVGIAAADTAAAVEKRDGLGNGQRPAKGLCHLVKEDASSPRDLMCLSSLRNYQR